MKQWAEVVKRFPEANVLQSPAYGEMNELLGDKVIRRDCEGKGWAMMIVRNAKRGRYLEIPCGPLIDWRDPAIVDKMMAEILNVAKAERCVFVRMRPQLLATDENLKQLEKMGLRRSPMHLAAEHTVMIDLTLTEEELLAGMRRQTRYEVRRATRLGITVEARRDEEIFREFHAVQLETARRQGFVPPNLKVLMAEREAFGDDAVIYVARTATGAETEETEQEDRETTHNLPRRTGVGEAIAYGLILRAGEEGDYYEAASTVLNRKMPGADAVLWRAMRDLKAAGFRRFNLWGIAPEGETRHRYAGVTTFKKGFGGEVVEYVPAQDLVLNPVKYTKNWVVETARRKRRHL